MEKIKKFFVKHRGYILFLFCILVLAAFLFYQYKARVENCSREPSRYVGIADAGGRSAASPALLLPGNVVEQTFAAAPGTYAFWDLQCATFIRVNTGSLKLTMRGPDFSQSWRLDCAEIEDNAYARFDFDAPLTVGENDVLTLDIEAGTLDEERCPTVYTRTNTERRPDRRLRVNGEVLDETLELRMCVRDRKSVVAPYIALSVLALLGMTAFYPLASKRKKVRTESLAAAALLFLGVFYNFVFPPMTVPDELVHYLSAYHYSNITLLENRDIFVPTEASPKATYLRADDYDLVDRTPNEINFHAYDMERECFRWTVQNREMKAFGRTGLRGPAYVFPSLGITAGRLLRLGAYPTFYLGRIFNLLFLTLCLYFSMRLMPFGGIALAAVAMLPMSLHLAASYSYDCYNLGMCMLLFAQILHLSHSEGKLTFPQLALTSLLALLALPGKIVYLGLAGLTLLIPKEKFRSRAQRFFYVVTPAVVGAAGIVLSHLDRVAILTGGPSQVPYTEALRYSFGYVLHEPFATVLLLVRTLVSLGNWYFGTMIGQSLGWFQLSFPSFYVTAFTLLLLLAFLKKEGEPKETGPLEKWYLAAVTAGTVLLIMFALMLDWTPAGNPVILGVQGRYFLPVLPLIFLVVRSDRLVLKKNMDGGLLFSSVFLNLLVLLNIFDQAFML